ncbi:DUF427 domain-containing protein [Kribbella albertanoniae]|uniref:DUF427 domain-containing protein n=1 Tax=Kribbella albertanoniae TaxID=1266829 RepID=A0A4R4PA37_9ACTN|nr:DUF427 domain-containing protein [Kribbella albertanoniae]TDC18704.1 DUF427 domain-containing protein [Kribbella albertanoniae]
MKRDQPGPGQESVWDYPRPPALELSSELVVVTFGGQIVAETSRSWRVLETSHPPTYYLPRSAFAEDSLRPAGGGSSYCEWKGLASYLDVVGGDRIAQRQAWWYPRPAEQYAELEDHIALYPGAMDLCTVDGEQVTPQPGSFYGGWVTSRVVGPFKGTPGTTFW